MKKIKDRIRAYVLITAILSTFGVQVIAPAAVFACGSATGSSQQQVLSGVDETGTDCNGSQVTKTLNVAVTILSIIIGVASIIMILVSGFKYITSSGDSNKVSSAKTTLTYALVGLAIAALAQFLVHFVLYQSTKA
jgi:uncharacterized membrane protein YuzA (DUF378 family)